MLRREALHAPLHAPDDGGVYRTIHNISIQEQRRVRAIPCGPGGVVHDYVPFYFGPRSPMLLQLHTGQVRGYEEDQRPLIYLTSTAQAVRAAGLRFVFSDGHGIASFTRWFDDLQYLDEIDWTAVKARYWTDTVQAPDRQRRKQAEFLIHSSCPWALIEKIAVVDQTMRAAVQEVLEGFPPGLRRPVLVRPDLYYDRRRHDD